MSKTFMPYFSHDVNASSDEKIIELESELGLVGYAVYFKLIERLCMANNFELKYNLKSLAYNLRIEADIISRVINDFDLFIVADDIFYSLSLKNRMSLKNAEHTEKSALGSKLARARWHKDATRIKTECDTQCVSDATRIKTECDTQCDTHKNKMRHASDFDAKERKEERKEIKETKESTKERKEESIEDSRVREEAQTHSPPSFPLNDLDLPIQFEDWWVLYNHSPYADSKQRCLGVWRDLSSEEHLKCLERVAYYNRVHPIPEQRHNPLNYLLQKHFNDDNLHFWSVNNSQARSGLEYTIEKCFGKTNTGIVKHNKAKVIEI